MVSGLEVLAYTSVDMADTTPENTIKIGALPPNSLMQVSQHSRCIKSGERIWVDPLKLVH